MAAHCRTHTHTAWYFWRADCFFLLLPSPPLPPLIFSPHFFLISLSQSLSRSLSLSLSRQLTVSLLPVGLPPSHIAGMKGHIFYNESFQIGSYQRSRSGVTLRHSDSLWADRAWELAEAAKKRVSLGATYLKSPGSSGLFFETPSSYTHCHVDILLWCDINHITLYIFSYLNF